QEERLAVCLDEGVPIISFFWRDPAALVPRAKAGNAIVLHTVGTAEAARRAVDCGVDVVDAQGWEAGGHVRGTVATFPLVPAVVEGVSPTPVVAAGGRRPWPCRRPRARSIGRMDRNAVSRQQRGGDPPALPQATAEGDGERHRFLGRTVQRRL